MKVWLLIIGYGPIILTTFDYQFTIIIKVKQNKKIMDDFSVDESIVNLSSIAESQNESMVSVQF